MPTLQSHPRTEEGLVAQIEALAPAAPWTPEHEFVVTDREARLSVDLPGVIPQNLHVAIYAGRLHVEGRRTLTPAKGARERTSTRRTGAFALDATLPEWIDPSRAFRVFEAGILTVAFPKRRASRPSVHEAD